MVSDMQFETLRWVTKHVLYLEDDALQPQSVAIRFGSKVPNLFSDN